MNKPFFTIITVCLNAGDSLYETVISVLNQNFTDFEVLVKDGGSIDGSLNKLPSDSKIRIITQPDTGIYDAMNQAIDYANGEYILFLNAADYFINVNVLSTFYKTIVENKHPELAYCDYMTTLLRVPVISPSRLNDFCLFRTMLCHQVCMVKKEAYIKLGKFDSKLRVVADFDFLLRLIVKNRASYIHIALVGVLYTSDGFSKINYQLGQQEVHLLRKKYFAEKYLFYKFRYALTFPNLRNKIANGSGLPAKLYLYTVNLINKF